MQNYSTIRWEMAEIEFLWGGVVTWIVDTDALPSSSPSLIWLSWGFGLAWAVTKSIMLVTPPMNKFSSNCI